MTIRTVKETSPPIRRGRLARWARREELSHISPGIGVCSGSQEGPRRADELRGIEQVPLVPVGLAVSRHLQRRNRLWQQCRRSLARAWLELRHWSPGFVIGLRTLGCGNLDVVSGGGGSSGMRNGRPVSARCSGLPSAREPRWAKIAEARYAVMKPYRDPNTAGQRFEREHGARGSTSRSPGRSGMMRIRGLPVWLKCPQPLPRCLTRRAGPAAGGQ